MERVSNYIARSLKQYGVKDVFMLTGYGAMYLNDAIETSGINYYATRNEATAPMMAEAYARLKQKLGVVCVTAGPGSTNAVPGLAEAFVDSAPILVLSGQVHKNQTSHCSHVKLRTFGTAEIDIIPIVEPLTKYAVCVTDPNTIRYHLDKAIYLATSGRPGPVWVDIPLDVQQAMIDEDDLTTFAENPNIQLTTDLDGWDAYRLLLSAKSPLLICGNGVRQSDSIKEILELLELCDIPMLTSRFAQDIIPHSHPNHFGHAGVKGSKYCKEIMHNADVILSLGCRLSPQLVGLHFDAFSSDAKIIMVDIDRSELKKTGAPIHMPICKDVNDFLNNLLSYIEQKKDIFTDWSQWMKFCNDVKNANPMITEERKRNPIDLYYFMHQLDECSNENHVLVTDAGSNYYSGGQVWKFNNGQREIASVTNAAMGTTIPLAIGCAVAEPDKQILAVTGDGSLELNIQELKTISHYNFNIKLFVINNGGYASMKKWQDTFFEGRRIDTEESTGAGTLNLKKIAEAFDLEWVIIDKYEEISDKLKDIMSNNRPLFIEVMTDNNQKIYSAF